MSPTMQAAPSEQKLVVLSEAEKSAILEQLERLLLDPYFKNSKRYPSFLRFVVTQALEGESDSLKERVLGVEVFGRSPDYDSTQDPIVRVTAAEIRKRIIKYYLDPAHRGEIRVLLPSGSYVPLFEFPGETGSANDAVLAEAAMEAAVGTHELETSAASQDAQRPLPASPKRTMSAKAWWLTLAGVLVLAVMGGVWYWLAHRGSAVDAFWAPVTDAGKPVLFCIADQSGYANLNAAPNAGPAPSEKPSANPTLVAAEDTTPLLNFISVVRPKVKSYRVLTEGQTNFTDLGQGPAILIGALDNRWTMFATNPLRFHFVTDAGLKRIWIEDRENPARRDWLVDADAPANGPPKDYAIVARFVDPNTGQITAVIAGLGHHGTTVAGEFVLSAQSLGELAKQYPKIWSSRNVEIVLETLVVNGHPGAARIDAVHTW